jgi:ATP-dependent DNA helicase RecG
LASTASGFHVAEADLVHRGFGDLAGVRQAGIPAFRVSDPARDSDLLLQARDDARDLVRKDPKLKRKGHQVLREIVMERWGRVLRLSEIG